MNFLCPSQQSHSATFSLVIFTKVGYFLLVLVSSSCILCPFFLALVTACPSQSMYNTVILLGYEPEVFLLFMSHSFSSPFELTDFDLLSYVFIVMHSLLTISSGHCSFTERLLMHPFYSNCSQWISFLLPRFFFFLMYSAIYFCHVLQLLLGWTITWLFIYIFKSLG